MVVLSMQSLVGSAKNSAEVQLFDLSATCQGYALRVAGESADLHDLDQCKLPISSHTNHSLFLGVCSMTDFDPRHTLTALAAEYAARADAIRHDLARSHSPDFAEQAQQRQNDEVLEALLAEAELAKRQVAHAQERLVEGRYGQCLRCMAPIASARLQAMPAAEFCLACADQVA
jgi:RNA polymerase-binding transcription factor DksA